MMLPPANGTAVPSITESVLATGGAAGLPPNANFGYHTIWLNKGDVVELVMNNYDTGEHPFHLVSVRV